MYELHMFCSDEIVRLQIPGHAMQQVEERGKEDTDECL